MAKLLTGTRIYGTGTVDTQLFVNGTEQAVSTTTGALEVIGGAGIGGNLHLGGISVSAGVQTTNIVASGTLGVTGTTTLTVLNATSATFSGTLGVTGTSVLNGLQASNIVASGTLGVTGTSTLAGITLVTNTTSATSITTGALVVSGGVGIGQDLRVGGVIYGTFNGAVTGTATNAINISGGTVGQVPYQTAPGTTSFYGPGTAGNVLVSNGAAAPSYNNTLTLAGTTAATNATSGALQIAGGVGINDNLFVTNNINAVSGQFVSTRANNATTGAGQIYLNGATGNRIDWNQNGVAAPAFTTRSAGAKLVLYPNISASAADYAFGIESGFLWSGVADTTNGFKWYGGTTLAATLSGTGNLTLVGDLAVNGGDITTTQATFNLINTTATTVNFAGAATSLNVGATSGSTNVRNNLIISGNLTVQGTTTIVDSTVTNIADPIITLGGGSGNNNPTTDDNKDRGVAFKWVNNGGTTSTGFFGYDDSTGHLTYIQTATITNEVVSGTKGAVDANLAGGTAMSIVYQSAANTTAFLAAGSSGFILQTNGTSAAPTWVSASGIGAGSATNSDAIRTIERTTAAAHFLTFVDSNNATNAYESLYTTSSFVINPQSGNVGIGTTSPAAKLDLYNAADAGSAANGIRVQRPASYGQYGYLEYLVSSDVTVLGSLYTGGTAASYGQIYFRQHSNGGAIKDAMVIDGSNNVGIGTTIPRVKLAIDAGSVAGVSELINLHNQSTVSGHGTSLTFSGYNPTSSHPTWRFAGIKGLYDTTSSGLNSGGWGGQLRLFVNRGGAADQFEDVVTITGGGNVGIGTNAPLAKLHIEGNSLILNTENSAQAKSLYFRYSNGATVQSDSYLVFGTGGSPQERMRITSTGGISFGASGTAYGTSGFVLKSNGDAAPTWVDPSTLASAGATNADNIRTVAQAANTSYYPTFVDSNNASNAYELVYTTSSFQINPFTGNIQIGMTSQDYQPSSGGNHTIRLNALNTSSIGFHDSGSTIASIKFSGAYGFEIGAYDGLYGPHNTILHGNVGIGTQSPGQVLEVNGRGLFTGATTASAGSIQVTSTDAAIRLKWTSSPVADKNTWDIRSVGNGTTPFLQFRTINDANTVFTDRVAFTNDGNVGVGTTAPRGKFESVTGANGVNTNADVPGTAGAFVGPTGAGQGSQLSIESNDAIAADTGGVLAFGGRYSGTALATWAAIKGLKEDATAGNYGGYLSFYTRTTGAGYPERMRITPAGGISFGASGTAYGSSGQVLQSNGNAAPTWINQSSITSGGTSLTSTYVGFGSGSNLLTGSANLTYASSILNVAYQNTFNTTTPGTGQYGIHLNGQTTNDSATGITFSAGGSNAGNAHAGIYSQGSGSYGTRMYFATTDSYAVGSKTRVMINELGNVGIGITSPSGRLHLYQTAGGSNTLTLDTNFVNGNAYAINPFITSVSNGGFSIRDVTNSVERLVIQYSTGNVGIGTTTPQYKLDVNNGATSSNSLQASFGTTMSAGYWSGIHFGYSESSNQLYRKSAIIFERQDSSARGKVHILNNGVSGSASATLADAKMTIQYDGGVGIGTTTTLNKFEVAGTSGQLFSVSDSFTGTIFSVNDISGIPSIEVLDTGLVKLAQYNGAVTIGTGTVSSSTAELSVYGMLYTSGAQGEIRASSEITAYFSSDRRLKENIKLIENPITIIDQIRGVTFDWTDEHMARRGGEDGYFVRKHDIGVIAQEVQAVLPELVGTREDGYLAVKYEKLVPLLIEAIKTQQKTIDSLVKDLDTVKEFINNLKNGI